MLMLVFVDYAYVLCVHELENPPQIQATEQQNLFLNT